MSSPTSKYWLNPRVTHPCHYLKKIDHYNMYLWHEIILSSIVQVRDFPFTDQRVRVFCDIQIDALVITFPIAVSYSPLTVLVW
jgi:hypothetical protein